MKTRTIFVMLLLTAVFAVVPGVSAFQTYLNAYNTTFNTNSTCSICHVSPAGGGPLTSYGMMFQNQTNHQANPSAALMAIGPYPSATPTVTVTATPTVTVTVTATPTVTVTATPTVTVTGTPTATVTVTVTPPRETRRVVEIIDNISGVPLINVSTTNILGEDFMNFNAGDRYNITITRVTSGTVEYNASGVLTGGPKQTIRVNWIPQTQGAYILRSQANTTTESRIVQVINQKVISPIPELSTVALVSAGLLGLFGLARKRKNN